MGSDTDSREVSRILNADVVDEAALLPLVYERLRAIADARMSGERAGHTLQATDLVHEAYLKLLGNEAVPWEGKSHFYAAAAEAMRRILIDHARARDAQKRGGGRKKLALDVVDLAARDDVQEILALDEAVTRLEAQDPRMAAIVKLRFFAGLSEVETAQVLGIGERTVRREWTTARAFLQRELPR